MTNSSNEQIFLKLCTYKAHHVSGRLKWKKMGIPVLVSEKFVFEKGIYSSKIQHILDLSHFPLIVNYTGKLQEEYTNIHHFKEK